MSQGMFYAKMSDRTFRLKMEQLRRWTDRTVPEMVAHRARVLCQDLIRWTPPRGPHPGSEGWKSMKDRGIRALRKDVYRVFRPVDQLDIYKNPKPKGVRLAANLRNAVASGDMGAIARILERVGLRFQAVIPLVVRTYHDLARTRRGRVPPRFLPYYVPRKEQIEAYIAKRIPKVGEFKSGWNSSAAFLKVPNRNWPSWVRSQGELNGECIPMLHLKDNPRITLRNNMKAAKDKNKAELFSDALKINDKKMLMEHQAIRRHLKKQIQWLI